MIKQERLLDTLRQNAPKEPEAEKAYFDALKPKEPKYKKLMKMPYLYFLCSAFESWEEFERPDFGVYIPLLYALLELTTNEKNIEIKTERKKDGSFKKAILLIGEVEFNAKDFVNIRQVLLSLGGIDYSDDFLNADAERAIHKGREFEMKNANFIPPSLEDLINILAMYMGRTTSEIINNFTVRKFNAIIRYMSKFEDYKLLKGAEMSGMVKMEKSVPPWISANEKHDILAGQQTDWQKSNMLQV